MLAAVILSAGASSRMGRPKALLPYREGTFLEHLIDVTRDPRIGVTRVVLGAGAEEIRAAAKLDPSRRGLERGVGERATFVHPRWPAQPGRNRN